MLSAENLASIESEGRRLGMAVRVDPERDVPQYPGWSLADLASHTASIHARTVLICRDLPDDRISSPTVPEGMDPVDWYDRTLEEMLAALTDADPDTPVWTFDESGRLAFWERRMVVETGLHRWDAETTLGRSERLSDRVTLEALDEFGSFWLKRLPELPTLQVTATDLGHMWLYGDGEPSATIEAAGSEVFLRLMQRPSSVSLPDEWAEAIDSMGQPPKR